MKHLPIACTLSEDELAERRRTFLKKFESNQLECRPLPNGLAFRFAPDAEMLHTLAHIIDLERQCCPFLTFRLTVEPQHGPVWLELTGPSGAREMLEAELGLGSSPS